MTDRKLLAIGLDSAEFDFIRARRGALPTLNRMLDTNLLHRPRGPYALSGAIWPTFGTGSEPGEHGVYQHLVWDADRMRLRSAVGDLRAARKFWSDLEDEGLRVVVFDVPYSCANNLRHGAEIAEWATHSQLIPYATNKPALADVLRRISRDPIGRETPIRKTAAQLDAVRQRLIDSAGHKTRAILDFMRNLEWDVFIAVFGELHRGGHALYATDDEDVEDPGGSALLDVYRAVDRGLARILDAADRDATAIMVFSLHGMERDWAQGHLMRPVLSRLDAAFLAHEGKSSPPARGRGMIGALRDLVPSPIQHAVGELAPDPVRRWVVEREMLGGLDWRRTPAFALRTDVRTEIRLNLAGREARGLLEPGTPACDRYLALLHSAFLGLRDADTGAPLVAEVVALADLYPGPRGHALPDLAVEWRREPPATEIDSPQLGRFAVKPRGERGGDHSHVGFSALHNVDGLAEGLPPLDRTSQFAGYIKGLAADLRAA